MSEVSPAAGAAEVYFVSLDTFIDIGAKIMRALRPEMSSNTLTVINSLDLRRYQELVVTNPVTDGVLTIPGHDGSTGGQLAIPGHDRGRNTTTLVVPNYNPSTRTW